MEDNLDSITIMKLSARASSLESENAALKAEVEALRNAMIEIRAFSPTEICYDGFAYDRVLAFVKKIAENAIIESAITRAAKGDR